LKYEDETRTKFADRVLRQHGFGVKRARRSAPSKTDARPVEEILLEQIAHQDNRAAPLFRFGPAEIWQRGAA